MANEVAASEVVPLLKNFLPRQRWYRGTGEPRDLRLVHDETERDEWPALLDLIVDADGEAYQVMVGIRPRGERPEFLAGRDDAVLGTVDGAYAYEATLDPELGAVILERVSGGAEQSQRVRAVSAEQSNTSLVYDDRLILKLFRRLQPGVNPEIEVTRALADVGFEHVTPPVATSEWGDYALSVLQPYLAGGVEGWALALTSLRDLFGVQDSQAVPIVSADRPPPDADPAQAGGDFSAEARRLGEMTAQMHAALADAFGRTVADAGAWEAEVRARVDGLALPTGVDRARIQAVVDAFGDVSDTGPAIRVHGDYHLGQVMRTDAGWYILDFEGEPDRPLDDRRRPTSPLRDVAGMLRSFHYAALVALDDRDELGLVLSWQDRNRRAFLDGYLPAARKARLLPDEGVSVETVLRGFELEKAAYELDYERAHRPDWERIPESALRDLLASARS
jgi:maltokinase